MKTTLLFVRHGQSIANENGIFAGHLDVPLSELGQKQAVELKDYLLSRYKIDAIYSSDLSRAYTTVLPTAEAIKIPIQKDTALREIDGGKWEGMLQKEIAVEYPQDYAVWHNNTGLSRCTGGESMQEVQSRGIAAVERIANKHLGQTVLIATHAGFLRAMQCYWQKLPLSKMKDITWVPNASVTEVRYSNDDYELVRLGETIFLKGDISCLD